MNYYERRKNHFLNKKNKNIRVFKKGKYYYVHFTIKKKHFSKMFKSKEYGSKLHALEAALNWRDNMKCAIKFAIKNGFTIKDW